MTELLEETELLAAVELECRASQMLEVDFPKRLIELVVMPYEETAIVPVRGRMVEEICTRGAFGNIGKINRRVPVLRDHEIRVGDTVGKATAFYPDRPEGLVAQVKILKGDDGDHALEAASGGCIAASAGFMLKTTPGTHQPEPGAEVWETRSRRRLNKLWLHHIALTPDPAYDGARVLAVRHATTAAAVEAAGTPNLDAAREILFELRYPRGQALQ